MTPRRAACTVIARNYLAQARVLAESYARHHDGDRLTVLVLDDIDHAIGDGEPFETVRPSDVLDPDEFARMATMYTVVELATAVKPFLLIWLLGRGAASVAYFDPDIEVFTPLPDVFLAAEEYGVALTPHALDPLPRGGTTTQPEDVILDVGVFNLGFIAVGSNVQALEWWAQRLARECIIDPGHGRFVDQRWVDLFTGYFAPAVLRDPGLNVAWWNLATRAITVDGDGYRVDGEPLRFFHFSGFDPDMPWLLSRHQGPLPRVLMRHSPALQRLTRAYGASLREAGYDRWASTPYALGMTPTGMPLDSVMRSIYRHALMAAEGDGSDEPPNPFRHGDRAFVSWLAAPDPDASGPHPCGRYAHAMWKGSPRLREQFPDVHGEDAEAFAMWAQSDTSMPNAVASATISPDTPPAPGQLEPGLHVVGLLSADRAEGEIGRRLATALLDDGLRVEQTTVRRLTGPANAVVDPRARPFDAQMNLLAMPPERFGEANHLIGERKRAGRRTAALFVDVPHDRPRGAMESQVDGVVDEIWVVSDRGRAQASDVAGGRPIRIMPPIPAAVDPLPEPDLVVALIDAAVPGAENHARRVVTGFQEMDEVPGNPRLKLVIIHADDDGQLLELVHWLTRADERIDIVEATPAEARHELSRAAVLVWLPADADSALPVVDALASGIKVVASDTGQAHQISAARGLTLVPADCVPAESAAALKEALASNEQPSLMVDDIRAFVDASLPATPADWTGSRERRFGRRRVRG